MGTFRIVIQATGGHGVDRSKKEGEKVDFYAEGESSPDAIAKKCLEELKAKGCQIEQARIIHWPETESEVSDNLETGIRKGNF